MKGVPHNSVWLPWRGNPKPSVCDTDRTVPGASVLSNLDSPHFVKTDPPVLHMAGWCWDKSWQGGGVPPMMVQVSVDGKVVKDHIIANVSRPGLPSKTGAPNPEHGFIVTLNGQPAKTLAGVGMHKLDVQVHLDPAGTGQTVPVKGSPVCFRKGVATKCKPATLLDTPALL